MYNLFVHTLSGLLYKNMQFDAKKENTTILLIFFGLMGIVSYKILDATYGSSMSTLANGLYYGGILLLLTVLIDNWQIMNEESHFIIISVCFGFLVWYAYNYQNQNQIQKKKT